MSATIAEVLAAIELRCRRVQTAAGFHTDAGREVWRGRESLGEFEALPALSIFFDGEESSRPLVSCARRQVTGTFVVVGFCQPEPLAPLARPLALMEDIKRALFGRDAEPELSRISQDIEYQGSELFYRDDAGAFAQVAVEFSVQWQEAIQ